MKIGKITSVDLLTKVYKYNEDKIHKETHAFLTEGSVDVIDIAFEDLNNLLDGLQPNEAITLGVPDGNYNLTTAGNLNKDQYKGYISRSKNYFGFQHEGVILFDIDEDISVDDALDRLYNLDPELKEAKKLIRHGTSSFIYNKDKDEFETKETSLHIFVHVKNLKNLGVYIDSLKHKAWELNEGYFKISKSGAVLERFIFDASVFSPERLVFEAGAVCEDPLEQRRPSGFYHGRGVKELRPVKYKKTISMQNKNVVFDITQKEALPIKEEFYRHLNKKYSGLTRARRNTLISKFKDNILAVDWVLYDLNGTAFYVGDINESMDDLIIQDPIVPTGEPKAIIYWNYGKPKIHSFKTGVFYCDVRLVKKNSLIDEEELLRMDIPLIHNNWEDFIEVANEAIEDIVSWKGRYLFAREVKQVKEYTDKEIRSTVYARIQPYYDFQFYQGKRINTDVYNAIMNAIISGIPKLDSYTSMSRYRNDFKCIYNNNKLLHIYPVSKATPPMEIVDDEGNPNPYIKTSNYKDIVDWYRNNKLDELEMVILYSVASAFGVPFEEEKSFMFMLFVISNWGKTNLVSDVLTSLGLANVVGAKQAYAMLGLSSKLGGGNPINFTAPIVLIDEAGNLNQREFDELVSEFKNFREGLEMTPKFENTSVIKGHSLFFLARQRQSVNSDEIINRLVKIDAVKQEVFDTKNLPWTYSEIKKQLYIYFYDVWLYYYNTLNNMSKEDASEFVNNNLKFKFNKEEAKKGYLRNIWSIVLDILVSTTDYIHPNNITETTEEHFVIKSATQRTPSMIYLTSIKHLQNYIYNELGLNKGEWDDIKAIFEKHFESKSAGSYAIDGLDKFNNKKQYKCPYRLPLLQPKGLRFNDIDDLIYNLENNVKLKDHVYDIISEYERLR